MSARERAEFVDALREVLGLDPIPDAGVARAQLLNNKSDEMRRIAVAVCRQVSADGNRWIRPRITVK